jgi:hypothetical protein
LKKILYIFIAITALGGMLLTNSCKKDPFANTGIGFSKDTLTFDTVFATLGSTTRSFKVFNYNTKPLKIESIRLAHLVGTQFRLNVDGDKGDQFFNIEIPARDSIYVFVEVTVDPNGAQLPFVIIDDVIFTTGGESNTVHLQAWGQNAHFHYGEVIDGNETWASDLPHVVIARDTVPGVYVTCNGKLTINPRTKVFFANNSGIFVEGDLFATASNWDDSIVFQGVRLEQYYNDKPGQWFGLVFLRNSQCGNIAHGALEHCVIDEASYAVYAGAGFSSNLGDYLGASGRPQVTMVNTIVKNTLYNAVYGFNAKMVVLNSLFYASGDNLVKLGLGGDYTFSNCTMYNKGSQYVSHENESLLLSDFVSDGTNLYLEPLIADFANSIIYGTVDNEVSFNKAGADFTVGFTNCLVKNNADTLGAYAVNTANLFNQEPYFEDYEGNFVPSDSLQNSVLISPLIDASSTGIPEDLRDIARPVNKKGNATPYDIGAYELQ